MPSIEDVKLGDGVFYGSAATNTASHVMLALGGGIVLGAHNGFSATFGQDPRAYVGLERVGYRSDLLGARRFQ